MVNLPNLISMARLLSVPIAVIFILEGRYDSAFWLFVAAGASDGIDGYIAKRFDARTTLGSYLDPLADKVLLITVYITLGHNGHLPDWLVILVVFRDGTIIAGAIVLHVLLGSVKMAPLITSKINTGAQILLAAVVLGKLGLEIDDRGLVQALIYVVALTTLTSGLHYLLNSARRVASMEDM